MAKSGKSEGAVKNLTEGSHPRKFEEDEDVLRHVRGDNAGNSANDPVETGDFGKPAEYVKPYNEQNNEKHQRRAE
jgi:hypothetical protein